MNLTNTTISDQGGEFPAFVKLPILFILLLCSFVGNAFLITVIFKNKTLKTSFNYLVVNMAISDLFVPVLVIPYEVSNTIRQTDEWPVEGKLGDAMCKLNWFISDISPAVSIFSLVVIAVNRFIAIVFPVHITLANTMNKRNKIFIAMTWIVAAILFSPHFLFFRLKGKSCYMKRMPGLKIYYSFIVFGTYFIPFTIIAILYSIMVSRLYRNTARLGEALNDKQNLTRQKMNKQIFLLSVAIILCCAVLVGPLFCYLFVMNFFYDFKYPEGSRNHFFVLHCVYILYTCSNPFVYFTFVKSFRRGLKSLLFGKQENESKAVGYSTCHLRLSTHFSKQSLSDINVIQESERLEMKALRGK